MTSNTVTIDEIRIEGEENGFHLIIYTDTGAAVRYRIGLPDTFKYEVDRTIGAWLAEGEAARVTIPVTAKDIDPDGKLWDPYLASEIAQHYNENPDLLRDIERGK